jgi:hypothetical protein
MHTRRIATFLLGAWMTGCILVPVIVMYNFRSVERLIESPGVDKAGYIIQGIGKQDARNLLRFWISDLNLNYFWAWEWAQMALAPALILMLVFATTRRTFPILLALLMLALTAFGHFYISSEIVYQSQGVDFLPAAQAAPRRERVARLHTVYRSLELVKLAASLFTMRTTRKRLTEVDRINHADDGHIDR